ncbi:MAG TPA: hypothetical protein VEP50_11110 [bacterium]|nr:hypothetical protein [bacterium]
MMVRDPRLFGTLAWGILLAVLYIVIGVWPRPMPSRVLYDGTVPLPPYRWVTPPPAQAKNNQPAGAGEAVLGLGAQGSPAVAVSTDDDQATITFPAGAIAFRPGDSVVRITITPLDPARLPPPPHDHIIDGNAYRVDVIYQGSRTPVTLAKPVTIALEYPVHATEILRVDAAQWTVVAATRFPASQQVVAAIPRLGTFVAARH